MNTTANRLAAAGFVLLLALTFAAPVSAEWRIRKLASWGGQVNAVEVNPPYIYMGSGARVLIVQESGFGNPQEVGALDLGGIVYGMDYKNGLLYVVSGTVHSTLSVIDVSDPANPVVVGSVTENFGDFRGVEVSGIAAYVHADGYGLYAFNVSNPAAPFEVLDNWEAASWDLTDLAVANGYIYATNEDDDELVIVKVTNPFNPVYQGKVTGLDTPHGVAVSGNYAYVADSQGPLLVVVDVSTPTSPVRVGEMSFPLGWGWDVAVSGTTVYLATLTAGLRIVDVSVPAAPVEIGAFDDQGNVERVTLTGTRAYLGDEGWGMEIIDVSDPADARRVGVVDSPGRMEDIQLADDRLFVCDPHVGVTIVDVSDPRDMRRAGRFVSAGVDYNFGPIDKGAYQTRVRDGVMYVSSGGDGLEIVDVSNPAAPTVLSNVPTNFSAWAMDLRDDLVYIGMYFDGHKIIDVSDPADPSVLASSLLLFGDPKTALVDADLVHYACHGITTQFTALSNPLQPHKLWFQALDAAQFARSGDLLYCAVHTQPPQHPWEPGLVIFDVSDPSDPLDVGQFVVPDECGDVALYGNRALVPSFDYLYLLDVSEPTSPVLLVRYQGRSDLNGGVTTDGRFAYLSELPGGSRGSVEALLIYQPGDFDDDEDVDLADFHELQRCYGGTGEAPVDAACLVFDIDEDDDVDGDDYTAFQGYFTGPG